MKSFSFVFMPFFLPTQKPVSIDFSTFQVSSKDFVSCLANILWSNYHFFFHYMLISTDRAPLTFYMIQQLNEDWTEGKKTKKSLLAVKIHNRRWLLTEVNWNWIGSGTTSPETFSHFLPLSIFFMLFLFFTCISSVMTIVVAYFGYFQHRLCAVAFFNLQLN